MSELQDEQSLDPRWITVARLAGGITAAVIGLILFVAMLFAFFFGPGTLALKLLLPLGWIVVSGAIAALLIGWPALAYRYISYRLCEQGLQIRRGVLWRSIVSVPRSRIQHTDVSQGPIERAYELSTLVVYTAGTEHASISLPGLARQTALAIRDQLLAGLVEDDAV